MSDQELVLHCPRCNFGLKVTAEAKEALCPQCGTKMLKTAVIILKVQLDYAVWLSEDQVSDILNRSTQYCGMLINQRCQGRKVQLRIGE